MFTPLPPLYSPSYVYGICAYAAVKVMLLSRFADSAIKLDSGTTIKTRETKRTTNNNHLNGKYLLQVVVKICRQHKQTLSTSNIWHMVDCFMVAWSTHNSLLGVVGLPCCYPNGFSQRTTTPRTYLQQIRSGGSTRILPSLRKWLLVSLRQQHKCHHSFVVVTVVVCCRYVPRLFCVNAVMKLLSHFVDISRPVNNTQRLTICLD